MTLSTKDSFTMSEYDPIELPLASTSPTDAPGAEETAAVPRDPDQADTLTAPLNEGEPTPLRSSKDIAHPVLTTALALLVVLVSGLIGGIIGHSLEKTPLSQASPGLQQFHITLPTSPATQQTRLNAAQKKIVKSVDKGIVDITATSGITNDAELATGMVITHAGLVLTNNHAIAGSTSISVREVDSGTTFQATVVGYDTNLDVAVLQLSDVHNLATVTLSPKAKIAVGEAVVAIGNADGANATPIVVTGKVLGKDKSIVAEGGPTGSEDLSGLVSDNADIVPGDSGGPLISPKGKIIAMDTAASTSLVSTSANTKASPRSFAVPIATVEKVVKALKDHHTMPGLHAGPSAFLGVEIGTTSASPGAVVEGVLPGDAAASVLTPGDVITKIDSAAVTSPNSLLTDLEAYSPGDSVLITYEDSSGSSATASLTLGTGPAQ